MRIKSVVMIRIWQLGFIDEHVHSYMLALYLDAECLALYLDAETETCG